MVESLNPESIAGIPAYRQWPIEDREVFVKPSRLIDIHTPIMTIGSCFAEYLMVLFEAMRFNVFDPHWGYKYSTPAIHRSIERALEGGLTERDALYPGRSGFTDLHHHRIFHPNPDTALWRINRIETLAGRWLPRTKVLVMTLGQNEVWKNLRRDEYINHPYPGVLEKGRDLEVHFLSVEENQAHLEKIHALLTAHIPDIQIIVTVSPVPLKVTYQDLDAVVGNNISKFTLYVAATQFAVRHDNVHYFPSFDIAAFELKAWEHWRPDRRHLRGASVGRILWRFAENFLEERTLMMARAKDRLGSATSLGERLAVLDELEELGYPIEFIKLDRALFYLQHGEYRPAVELFEGIGQAEHSPFIQHALAGALMKLGRNRRALACLTRCLELTEDVEAIAFAGAKRDHHLLYGSNHLRVGWNFSDERREHIKTLRESSLRAIELLKRDAA